MVDPDSKCSNNILQPDRHSWTITVASFAPLFVALFIPLRPDNPLAKIAQSLNISTSVVFLAFFAIMAIIIGVGLKFYKLRSETTPLEVRKKGALIVGLCFGILYFAIRLFLVR
jgi:hypothetical protein